MNEVQMHPYTAAETVRLQVEIGGKTYSYPKGTSFGEIASDFQQEYPYDILLVKADGNILELGQPLLYDHTKLQFITADTKTGNMAYRRSLSLLAVKAIQDVVGRINLTRTVIDFSVSKGYYIDIEGNVELGETFAAEVEARMRDLVAMKLPITKENMPTWQAMRIFRENGMHDKEKLLKYRRTSTVNLYTLGGFRDYYYGYMVPNTGLLRYFKVYAYGHGLVVQMPDAKTPDQITELRPYEKLFQAQYATSMWLKEIQVPTVGALNDQIVAGNRNGLILTQEAIMEKKIADIAEAVVADPRIRLVMIAGPSSSGKTTFSHRLSVQLRAHGRNPHPLGCDNYYHPREECPLDAEGKRDFECLEAIDTDLFNQNMTDLLAGKMVDLPTYNFKTGLREYNGNRMQMGPEDILVIEGIHCLNDALSRSIPKENKYKIYISALTQLNLDEHDRIPTTDVRLLRRIVRDARTRGTSAGNTIRMWDSVRRGEEQYIFPYQDNVNVIFNSALVYELSVLKQYAEPLLYGITPEEEEYDEAQRLLKFLDYFLGIDSINVPSNSLLKEFIGGSCFDVG